MNRRDYAFAPPRFPQTRSHWHGFIEAMGLLAFLALALWLAACQPLAYRLSPGVWEPLPVDGRGVVVPTSANNDRSHDEYLPEGAEGEWDGDTCAESDAGC